MQAAGAFCVHVGIFLFNLRGNEVFLIDKSGGLPIELHISEGKGADMRRTGNSETGGRCPCGRRHNNTGLEGPGVFHVVRLLIAAIVFVLGMFLKLPELSKGLIIVASAIIAGGDIALSALGGIIRGHFPEPDLLMTIAVIAVFAVGAGNEGAAFVLLYQAGRIFQDYTVGKLRGSISRRVDTRSETATVLRDGREEIVSLDSVRVGETIVIKPGERVPLDCVIVEGTSALDISGLTGDSQPQLAAEEEKAPAGAINQNGLLKAEVIASASDSTAPRIAEMVLDRLPEGGKSAALAEGFARGWTVITAALAVVLAVMLPIVTDITFSQGIRRALVFLTASAPCAIFISAPLSHFTGIAGAAKKGILFKSGKAVDAVSKATAVVLNPSGILMSGSLSVTAVKPRRIDADTMLRIAAHAEAYSNHPVAKSIKSAYKGPIYLELIESFRETAGQGVTVMIDGKEISLGTRAFLNSGGVDVQGDDFGVDIAVFMSVEGIYAGRIVLSEPVKANAAEVIHDLSHYEGKTVTILSGEADTIIAKLANTVGIRKYYAACSPEDKELRVREMMNASGEGNDIIFVGVGENDVGALRATNAGIIMGGFVCKEASSAAGAIVIDRNPDKIITAIRAARHMKRIFMLNVAVALMLKATVLLLGAFGLINALMAVAADIGIFLLAVFLCGLAFSPKPPVRGACRICGAERIAASRKN